MTRLLHENVLPAFGVPQNAVLAAYGVMVLAYSWVARPYLRSVDGLFFLGAIGSFAVSLDIDIFIHSPATMRVVAADGAKFIGIWCWMIFHGAALARGLIFADMAEQPKAAKEDWAADDDTVGAASHAVA